MAESHQKRTRWSGRKTDDRRTAAERSDHPVTKDQRLEEQRSSDRRRRVLARVGLGIDYLFFLLYSLLALRIVLTLVDANEQAAFVRFVHSVTEPFYGPFSDIVASPSLNGGELDMPALIALFVYGLLHLAIRKLLRVFAGPPGAAQQRLP